MEEFYGHKKLVNLGHLRSNKGNLDGMSPPLEISPYAYDPQYICMYSLGSDFYRTRCKCLFKSKKQKS